MCLAIQQMNEEAAQKAAQKERISTLFASIKNLMEKNGLVCGAVYGCIKRFRQ